MTSDNQDIPAKLRENADQVVRVVREKLEVELSFDQAGVIWIDDYIHRLREQNATEDRSGLVSTLGAFVGESIIQTFGGTWMEIDGMWGVQVNDRVWACPFAKVAKQFENGPEDSVADFFRTVPELEQYAIEQQ
ncbi:MAG: hypothetical protein HC921_04220 [Synechococcaceae cyanobacterium SM2_3_1]|nr:hypothetical protein [Synechococcaceae cyanobacterium SM2_3_1]